MAFANLELDDEDKIDFNAPMAMKTPDYPIGMRLCLDDSTLRKLGIDDTPEVGDYLLMTVIACVTHCSCTDNGDGVQRRVELQIEKAHALEADAAAAQAFAEEETEEGEL